MRHLMKKQPITAQMSEASCMRVYNCIVSTYLRIVNAAYRGLLTDLRKGLRYLIEAIDFLHHNPLALALALASTFTISARVTTLRTKKIALIGSFTVSYKDENNVAITVKR
jgi:hypothetical protein